jgi:hypothetical protein
MWAHLNRYLDPEDPAYSDPLRRVMAHLGDYAALIVEPLKARPTDATLVRATNQRIEVRLTTVTHHLLLVIAPEADLAHEVFFLRSLAACDLPAPRLIAYDLSCANVPFTYAIETYPGSLTLDRINDAALVASPGDRLDECFGGCIVSRRPVMARQHRPVAGRRERGAKRWQAGLSNAVSMTGQRRFWAPTSSLPFELPRSIILPSPAPRRVFCMAPSSLRASLSPWANRCNSKVWFNLLNQ